MASVDKVRVGNTDYEMAGFCKVYDTIAQMQADINNIPDGCMVYVKENSPSGLAGDAALDTVSTNWVQNKVVAQAINSLSSDLASITAAMNTCFDEALDTSAGWKTKALSSPLRKFVTLRAYVSGSTTLYISTMPKAVFDLFGSSNPIRLMGTDDSNSLYVASYSGQNFRTYNATGITNLKLAVYTQD